MKKHYFIAFMALLICFSLQSSAQLFQQNFNSSNVVSDYVSTTPNTGQFNAIGTSGAGTSVAISSGKLSFNRSTGSVGTFSRTTDLSPEPGSLKYSFDLTVSGNSIAQTTAAVFQVGSNFGTTNNFESVSNVHSRIGINFTATNGEFSLRDIGTGVNSSNYVGTQAITWYINNTSGAITYIGPNGGFEVVSADKADVWIGNTRELNEVNATTATQLLTDLKFAFFNGFGTIEIDNILINPIVSSYFPVNGATDLSQLNNWTSDVNGITVAPPSNFSSANQNFYINRNASLSGDLVFSGGSNLEINNATLTINSPGRLSVGTGSTADLKGNSVVIKSGASIGTITGTLIGATNITVERDIPTAKRAWRLLTAPVAGTSINAAWQEGRTIASASAAVSEPAGYGTLITGGSDYADAASANAQGFDFLGNTGSASIRVYTQGNSSGDWNSTLPTTSPIDSRQAYMIFIRGDRTVTTSAGTTTLRATGLYKTGTSVAVDASKGFTLVGNPYPSPIDFESIYQTNSSTIQHRFWVWDATAGSFGSYKLINWTGGTGASATYEAIPSPYTGSGAITDLKTIYSGQGFFVEPTASGGTLSISENHKTATAPATNIFRVGNGSAEKLSINLNYLQADNTASLVDGVQAKYDAAYSMSVTTEDIQKPNNFNENIAINRSGKYLIVEGRPLIGRADTTYLTLWNTTERTYQFQLKADNFNTSAVSAYLVDKFTSTSTRVSLDGDVTNINFTVTADPASKALDRFMVVYRVNNTLPVDFRSIKASQKNTAIKVEWNVATETNIKSYEVERSVNGQQFIKAGTVTANRSSAYSWLDKAPSTGINYYRIKVISANDEPKYSNVVRVALSKGRGAVSIFPNPITGKNFNLQLSNKDKGNYTVRITNTAGQVLFSKTISHGGGSATQTIYLFKELPKGVYQLEVAAEDGTKETTKIIYN